MTAILGAAASKKASVEEVFAAVMADLKHIAGDVCARIQQGLFGPRPSASPVKSTRRPSADNSEMME